MRSTGEAEEPVEAHQRTLIANGDNDRMVPSTLSEDLHRRIEGSDLIVYPRSPDTAAPSSSTTSSPPRPSSSSPAWKARVQRDPSAEDELLRLERTEKPLRRDLRYARRSDAVVLPWRQR